VILSLIYNCKLGQLVFLSASAAFPFTPPHHSVFDGANASYEQFASFSLGPAPLALLGHSNGNGNGYGNGNGKWQ